MLASIANSILAYVIYYDSNDYSSNDAVAEKIDQARSIMRENMLTDITPEQVADKINMSYSWFRKTFKEYTNVSPAHYITQLKLQKAKLMLLNSPLSIKEIAFYLKYEDAAYFQRSSGNTSDALRPNTGSRAATCRPAPSNSGGYSM